MNLITAGKLQQVLNAALKGVTQGGATEVVGFYYFDAMKK